MGQMIFSQESLQHFDHEIIISDIEFIGDVFVTNYFFY